MIDNLKNILKEKKMSRRTFASKLGMSESNLSRYLNGQYSFDSEQIRKISDVLDVDVNTLIRSTTSFKELKQMILASSKSLTIEEKIELINIISSRCN